MHVSTRRRSNHAAQGVRETLVLNQLARAAKARCLGKAGRRRVERGVPCQYDLTPGGCLRRLLPFIVAIVVSTRFLQDGTGGFAIGATASDTGEVEKMKILAPLYARPESEFLNTAVWRAHETEPSLVFAKNGATVLLITGCSCFTVDELHLTDSYLIGLSRTMNCCVPLTRLIKSTNLPLRNAEPRSIRN